MSLTTRDSIRSDLAAGLQSGYGSSVYAVYDFMATGWDGKSPVVRVMNAGSMRPRRTGYPAAAESMFRYAVQHFIRYDDSADLTDQKASEVAMDTLEYLLSTYLSDYDQVPGQWKQLSLVDYSEPALVKIGAFQYLLEAFLVEVKLSDN